ncbi:PHA/PHB synthase family protein [Hoyosella subflava]|uniref:Poly-beta-hydroxybutyrate polymerase domain protein n=1 Tax=Hoyosella subflava (strain DSM 45089 / JCM 17490 / NBRC 109087 / DQS3-9A1) TaxID=443218 RepID=F6EMQ9_HOYSD|nr:alpha/beta fold hydrolase [Hoyosella subflava]AEF41617.1 Poly-beta-hydroxybutyrate polymerase domain protein [Hoyosella subflava DQS3-9A1]
MVTISTQRLDDTLAEASAPIDMLLTNAARGQWRRFLPGASTLKLGAAIADRPSVVADEVVGLVRELARVGTGNSEITPNKRDRRFNDAAWLSNPWLRAILQGYLAIDQSARSVIGELELDWRDRERVEFALENILDAVSPSNIPGINPLSLKALIDTGGFSAVRGVRNLLRDFAKAPRVPAMVDTSGFTVGVNIAATDGAVVLSTPSFELIHYHPVTEAVGKLPLLIVPPLINKYYVVDLAPGRSLVEYLISQGQQVFTLSWRNPTAEQRDWGVDEYAKAVIRAFDAVQEIAGTERAHTLSLCSGGALMSMVAAHLSAIGQGDRIASVSLGVNVLDQSQAGLQAALAGKKSAKAAIKYSASKGYLDGGALAEMFAWMRPNDLVWSYWVNNYLQGKDPAPFDVLFWNADTTRMTAALHRDFIELFLDNKLAKAGTATLLGTAIDLSGVKADSYVVAGVADHISPWQASYRSALLLGGDTRFVLSTSGHIACMVNPPSNPKASFRVNPEMRANAEDWLGGSKKVHGSWWPDYAQWLADRNEGNVPAPRELGSEQYPAGVRAPGQYVFES